jgi:hypothetical protein
MRIEGALRLASPWKTERVHHGAVPGLEGDVVAPVTDGYAV